MTTSTGQDQSIIGRVLDDKHHTQWLRRPIPTIPRHNRAMGRPLSHLRATVPGADPAEASPVYGMYFRPRLPTMRR